MTFKELKALAENLGVDTKGLRSKRQVQKALDTAAEGVEIEPAAPQAASVVSEPEPPKPAALPEVQVYGFPRSGNHALAAMLKEHLYADVDTSGQIVNTGTGHWSQRKNASRFALAGEAIEDRRFTNPYAQLLGNHRPPPDGDQRCLYIYRDGRDVASSLYAWPKARNVALLGVDFGIFLRMNLDWWGSPGTREIPRRNKSLFHYWQKHLKAWNGVATTQPKRIKMVRYENLVTDPRGTMRDISLWLGIDAPSSADLVPSTGWNSSGDVRVGKWLGTWEATDLAFYDALVAGSFFGRWSPPSE